MIVEYIRYSIPLEQAGQFEAAYATAKQWLLASPHCLGYELSQCTEDPNNLWSVSNGVPPKTTCKGFARANAFHHFLRRSGPTSGVLPKCGTTLPRLRATQALAHRSGRQSPNYSFKRTAATGCGNIMRRSAAAA